MAGDINAIYTVHTQTAIGGTSGDLNTVLQTNEDHRGGHFTINITSAQGSTSSATFTLQGLVPGTTGTFYTILASTPLTAEGQTVLKVYPGLSTDANAVANDVLPYVWRVNVDHTGAETLAYTIGASLVV